MKTWAEWLPDILPLLPGCPDMVAEHAVKRAAQEFFSDTLSWKADLDPITASAGDPYVDLIPDETGAEVIRLESLRINGVSAEAVSTAQAIAEFGGDWESHTGTPSVAVVNQPELLRLVPSPSDTVTVSASIAQRPGDSSTGLPDNVFRFSRKAIMHGAVAILAAYAGQPWANAELAIYHKGLSERESAKLNVTAARRFGRGQFRASPKWC